MKKITKAILPVAGLGTRFLPATKTIPKEMLPIVDTPLIEYAVLEAMEAGIKEIIFITSHTKKSIERYFMRNLKLEETLLDLNKSNLISEINLEKFKNLQFHFIQQKKPKGLGDAVLKAKDLIADEEFFAVLLADDLFDGTTGVTHQLNQAHERTSKNVIAINEVLPEETKNYGVIDFEVTEDNSIYLIKNIIEKPQNNPPSSVAVTGRYILSGRIFSILKDLDPGFGNEIQLTDAIQLLALEEEVLGLLYDANKFDCGSKQGFVDATIYFSQKNNINELS
tara:strand:+ start:20947 stop:21789 length:843 start_codon:yes stop_codon:yes gene_type:complete